MGYMYDKLKETLGGSKFSSSHQNVLKDWTPNGVKALIIARDFIFVAYHVKMPKIVLLDVNEVVTDIQQNGKNGALHNLLAQRQLSCMEEFYVDSVYLNYPGTINMEQYIDKLVNEKSRLRFYGYIRSVTANEVKEKFSRAKLNGDPLYSYALDRSRTAVISYKSVENSNWFKNYNLRPQFYALDSEDGELCRWFMKSEKIIEERVATQVSALRNEATIKAVTNLAYQDMGNLEQILIYLSLGMYLKNAQADKIFTCVMKGMYEGQHNFKSVIKEVPTQVLNSAFSVISSAGDSVKNLARAYKQLNIFEIKESAELDLDVLTKMVQSGNGLLQFPSMLDSVLYEIWIEMENHYAEGKLILVIEAQKYMSEIPSGKFRSALGMGEGSDSTEGLIKVLLGVCGWNQDSFKKYLQDLQKQKVK